MFKEIPSNIVKSSFNYRLFTHNLYNTLLNKIIVDIVIYTRQPYTECPKNIALWFYSLNIDQILEIA